MEHGIQGNYSMVLSASGLRNPLHLMEGHRLLPSNGIRIYTTLNRDCSSSKYQRAKCSIQDKVIQIFPTEL
jgi:hypothetical protein